MPSGKFTSYPIDSITILRDDRQRRDLEDVSDLTTSITRIGLVNPIVITPEGVLVAGERRLTACRLLGWTAIPAQYTTDLDEIELELIELEENLRRKDISWQEQCTAIRRMHDRLIQKNGNDWTQAQTAEYLGHTEALVQRYLFVEKELSAGNTLVASASGIVTATNMVRRKESRAVAELIRNINPPQHEGPPILNLDFYQWLESYEGRPFNFLHCDPPYGIKMQSAAGMNKANRERYADNPEDFFNFVRAIPRIPIEDSCHMMLWFSMTFYPWTKLELHNQGWIVSPFPLVWGKSDNLGIMPDPDHEGRRNYETAFLCTKGQRKLAQPVSNIFWGARGDDLHPSVKPRDMLRHFLRMFVDSTTSMLDPTCGSGNAVRVSKDMGASLVLGLERDPVFHRDAVTYWSE